MSLHGDLLDQADHLATKEPKKPRQASLRRAVSAAYYALFHLLIDEATRRFLPRGQLKPLRPRVARAFHHATMKKVSSSFASGTIPPRLQTDKSARVQTELRFVAGTFCDLQDARHDADYNLAQRFSRGDVIEIIRVTRAAFGSWRSVRDTPQADAYLAGLLVFRIMQG